MLVTRPSATAQQREKSFTFTWQEPPMGTGQLELRWIASSSASALRGAWLLITGRQLTSAPQQQQLAAPAAQLQQVLQLAGDDVRLMFHHLLPLAAGIEGNRELAQLAVRKSCGPSAPAALATRLAEAIGEVERAFRAEQPAAADDLLLRGKPLREQWEARGPGMLRQLATLTEPELIVPRADVLLVHPLCGGGGEAHLAYNAVTVEALLANPLAELPEVVRLAWLLAQLHLDLPRFSERVSRDRLTQVAALALVPPVLLAAQHVELAVFSEDNLRRALAAWCFPQVPAGAAMILWDWWATYTEARPSFAVALEGLEKLLDS